MENEAVTSGRGRRMIGPFRLGRTLAASESTTVYRATDTRLNRPVAVRLLNLDVARHPRAAARFLDRARRAARFRHPNIVAVYEAGNTTNGIPYVVMEWLEGQPLSAVIAQRGRLSPLEAASIVGQLASAVEYLHRQGFVPAGLHPSGITVAEDGRVTLTDFGAIAEADVDATGFRHSQQAYLAPEQLAGQASSPTADGYTLALIALEMLDGRPAAGRIGQGDEEPMRRRIASDIPRGISAVLLKQLSARPELRYASIEEFAHAFTEALRSRSQPSIPALAPQASQPTPEFVSDESQPRSPIPDAQFVGSGVPEQQSPGVMAQAARRQQRLRTLALTLVLATLLALLLLFAQAVRHAHRRPRTARPEITSRVAGFLLEQLL